MYFSERMKNISCILEIFALSFWLLGVSSVKDHGPFHVKILDFRAVVNEKFKRDIPSLDIDVEHFNNGSAAVHIFGEVKRNLGGLGIKIKNYEWNERLKKWVLGFNIASKNFCEKMVFQAIAEILPGFGATDCKIKPMVYNITIPDFEGYIRLLTNNMFYYGKYRTITEMRVTTGRFLLTNVTALIYPEAK